MEREVTALKAQIKNPNRISVFLDGEYAFGLARIVAAWLHIGQHLSEAEIERLQTQDTYETAYQRALNFLSYRVRSETEVRRKLNEQGYDALVADATIERLKNAALLGDEQFAQTWVENRSTFRPRSKRMLAVELRQKGVESEVIEEVLADADDDALAYQTAIKYARRLDRADYETFRKKLGDFLMRRGFSYGTIRPVLQQVWDETHPLDTEADDNPNETEDG